MNFLSRFISSKPAGQKSLVTLSPGTFSIVRKEDSPKGHRELIFKEAEISLVTTTRQFFLRLNVHDLNKEDDELSETEADASLDLEAEDENSYLVQKELQLGYYLGDEGRVAIGWKDLDSDEGDQFEFLCAPTVSKEALDKFDLTACEAQYGQKYGTSPPADAPSTIYDEFNYNYASKPLTKLGESQNDATEGENTDSPSDVKHEFSEGRTTVSAVCDLCVYDSAKGVFVSPKSFQKCQVVILDQGKYEYFMEVRTETQAVMGVPVQEELNQYIDLASKALIFNYAGDNNVVMSYLLRFQDSKTLAGFDNKLAIALYETKNRVRFNDVAEDQHKYLIDALNNTGIDDSDMPDQELDDSEDEKEEPADEGFREADAEFDEQDREFGDSEKNSALEVGHVNDRSYVLRGDKIGVFKNTNNDLEYSTTIRSLPVQPRRILLHEQDHSLVIQGQKDFASLYRMDLETGKIVDEWNTGREVVDFNPVSKLAPTTMQSNLFGVAEQSMFRIDPRVKNGQVGGDEKIYKSKTGFSNIVTTGAGYIVVGNQKGDIRLYDQLGKTAKVHLPGLGDKLIGLDVSSDGEYLLATCATYILLIDGLKSGFTKSFAKDLKPVPRKLQITPENAVYMYQQTGARIQFTRARFNTGVDAKAATIVTSTGPYLVTWNLQRVLRGDRSAYRIKKYTSNITAENFQFGTDKRVILTLEDDVNMVSKSALQNPNSVLKATKTKKN